MYKMGELAVKKMLERIDNLDAPTSSQRVESSTVNFTPSLVVRANCGAKKNYVFNDSN